MQDATLGRQARGGRTMRSERGDVIGRENQDVDDSAANLDLGPNTCR